MSVSIPAPRRRAFGYKVIAGAVVGVLILVVGFLLLVNDGVAVLMILPAIVLAVGLYWASLAVDSPKVEPGSPGAEAGGAQPVAGQGVAPQPGSEAGPPADEHHGDTPTVRGERPRLVKARAYDLAALAAIEDSPRGPQCPNCGQVRRLVRNNAKTHGMCTDCGQQWQLASVQPPTVVRSHVRVNVLATSDETT